MLFCCFCFVYIAISISYDTYHVAKRKLQLHHSGDKNISDIPVAAHSQFHRQDKFVCWQSSRGRFEAKHSSIVPTTLGLWVIGAYSSRCDIKCIITRTPEDRTGYLPSIHRNLGDLFAFRRNAYNAATLVDRYPKIAFRVNCTTVRNRISVVQREEGTFVGNVACLSIEIISNNAFRRRIRKVESLIVRTPCILFSAYNPVTFGV